MRKRRFSEEQITRVVAWAQAGNMLRDVCRENRVSQGPYYRWKAKYRGLDVSEARSLRGFEQENRRLKAAVAELTLGKQALKCLLFLPPVTEWTEPPVWIGHS